MNAIHDDVCAIRELPRSLAYLRIVAPSGAGDDGFRRIEHGASPHVDDRRAIRAADQAPEFIGRNTVE
jgi:hypothetical protein